MKVLLQVSLTTSAHPTWKHVRCHDWQGDAIDEGDAVADWLTAFLKQNVRLVKYGGKPPPSTFIVRTLCNPAFANYCKQYVYPKPKKYSEATSQLHTQVQLVTNVLRSKCTCICAFNATCLTACRDRPVIHNMLGIIRSAQLSLASLAYAWRHMCLHAHCGLCVVICVSSCTYTL